MDDRQDQSEPARAELERYFQALMRQAPPVPAKLLELATPRRLRWSTVLMASAAALIVALMIGFFVAGRGSATAAELVHAAASRYLELRDARLRVGFRSAAVALLEKIFSTDEANHEGAAEKQWQILFMAPNRLLFFSGENDGFPSGGFDGEMAWSFDAKEGVAHVTHDVDVGELDLTHYLTFEFVRELAAQEASYVVAELTGPFDQRIGRRTFRLTKPTSEDGARFFWNSAVITIDPRTQLIERSVINIALGPVSLIEVTVELESVNEGVEQERFTLSRNLPAGTRIDEGQADEAPAGEPAREALADGEPAPETAAAEVERLTGLAFAVTESGIRHGIISTKTPYGLKIQAVRPGSAAARAGLGPGDVLMLWDGQPVRSVDEVRTWISAMVSEAKLGISRRNKSSVSSRDPWQSLEVVLELAR